MASGDERSGDLGDFELLVDEYGDRLYAAVLRITGSPADAEDALQDTFLQAFEHRSEFRGDASPTTWLYRIAVNAALARVRRRKPAEYLDDTGYEAQRVVDWSRDLDRLIENEELRRQLEDGISRLPEDLRVVVVLRDVEGFSAAETGRILDLGEAAVKSRLHRGRVLLRQWLTRVLREA